jgi:hypothetical protein
MFGVNYGQTKPFIDLISIGIVAEDGREYYAVSKDFNLEEAWNRFEMKETSPAKKYMGFYEEKVYWIRENVLRPIYNELSSFHISDKTHKHFGERTMDTRYLTFSYKSLKWLLDKYGKTNKQIAEEIKDYISDKRKLDTGLIDQYGFTYNALKTFEGRMRCIEVNWGLPQFYAYYGAFDYVAFSQIFGGFEGYPKSFPQYFIDLKQELDKIEAVQKEKQIFFLPLKEYEKYPKQTNEHSAIHDARWNKQLHEFINKI